MSDSASAVTVQKGEGQGLVGVIAGSLTIAALFLPFAGVAVRFLSFAFGGVVPPSVATVLPLADLASIGLFAVSPVLGLAFAYSLFGRVISRIEHINREGNAIDALGPIVREGTQVIGDAKAEIEALDAELDGVMARIRAAQLGDLDLVGSVEVAYLFDRASAIREKVAEAVASVEVQVAAIEARFDAQLEKADRYLQELRSMLPRFIRRTPFLRRPMGVLQYAVPILFLGLGTFPGYAVLGLLIMGTMDWLERHMIRARRRLTIMQVVPLFILFMLGSAIGAAISPTRAAPSSVDFSPQATLGDGEYVVVGRDEQFVVLLTCDDADVYFVPLLEIRSIRQLPRRFDPLSPSIWGMVTAGVPLRHLGLRAGC